MNILFIGAINLNQKPKGGEEFKNQLFLTILKDQFNLTVIDTNNWKRKPWIFFILIFSILNNQFGKIVVSTSTVSAYRLFSFLNYCFASKLKKIKYFVIGGYLPDGIQSGKLEPSVYRNLGGIIVEGNLLKDKLEKFKIHSKVVPNFKNDPIFRITQEQIKLRLGNIEQLRFVFLSRMIEEKGIFEILEAVKRINQEHGIEKLVVDFYGPIEEKNLLKFNAVAPSNCNYKGYLDLSVAEDLNYAILSTYHVMLFPTRWFGEGFPGIFLDAFICGLPVICSNNNMNNEIILNSYNGIVLEIHNEDALKNSMLQLMNDKNLLYELSLNSFDSFQKFSISSCEKLILQEIIR
jgi:glycosyltransferase involved in cell wall biosynthesis